MSSDGGASDNTTNGTTPSRSVPEPIASFIDTVNRHDPAGFLAAFTDDGVVDDWGRVFEERDAIEAWSDREFIGSHGTLTVTDVSTTDTDVTVTGDWRSTDANGPSAFTFTTVGDKIASMTIREG